jgi:hypothetical protein
MAMDYSSGFYLCLAIALGSTVVWVIVTAPAGLQETGVRVVFLEKPTLPPIFRKNI